MTNEQERDVVALLKKVAAQIKGLSKEASTPQIQISKFSLTKLKEVMRGHSK